MKFAPDFVDAARRSAAWPFEEARKLVARVERTGKGEVIFETGYGPSGLPHIGTFGEVARTSMVRQAFRVLTEDSIPTRLIAFSDDMDGLRKAPDNVPGKAILEANLGRPLGEVPDPFGTHESFGAHNNARLRAFLDRFGFDYEFRSATEAYRSGAFDPVLLKVLERYDEVMAIMLSTLREERASTYSPFLPIHPETRVVMQVPVEVVDAARGLIAWVDPASGRRFETLVTGGHAKLQWKVDWAIRWCALGVDYEMAGKDLIDSVKVSSSIARVLDGTPPEGFNYELFLDAEGRKISKTLGNGLSVEEWLSYASPESLALYMYQRPREAKKLHFDVIPRAADDYLQFLNGYGKQDWRNRLGNPVWHVHGGNPPAPEAFHGPDSGKPSTVVTFALLMNLAAVANADTKEGLWAYLGRHAPEVGPETHPGLDSLVGYALRYFDDFVRPEKAYRLPTPEERVALEDLSGRLSRLAAEGTTDAAVIQDAIYDAGRREPYATVQKDGSTGVSGAWFNTLYEILLGEPKGPRFGSFVAIYGIEETRGLIARALRGDLVSDHAAFLAEREGGASPAP